MEGFGGSIWDEVLSHAIMGWGIVISSVVAVERAIPEEGGSSRYPPRRGTDGPRSLTGSQRLEMPWLRFACIIINIYWFTILSKLWRFLGECISNDWAVLSSEA